MTSHDKAEREYALIRIEQLQRRAAIVDAATIRAHQLRDEAIDEGLKSIGNGFKRLFRRLAVLAHALTRQPAHVAPGKLRLGS